MTHKERIAELEAEAKKRERDLCDACNTISDLRGKLKQAVDESELARTVKQQREEIADLRNQVEQAKRRAHDKELEADRFRSISAESGTALMKIREGLAVAMAYNGPHKLR